VLDVGCSIVCAIVGILQFDLATTALALDAWLVEYSLGSAFTSVATFGDLS
jgi:hypothetical protein